jgi:hypothetical protein
LLPRGRFLLIYTSLGERRTSLAGAFGSVRQPQEPEQAVAAPLPEVTGAGRAGENVRP